VCAPLEGTGAGWFSVWEDELGREEISLLALEAWLGRAGGEELVTCGKGVENSTSIFISTPDPAPKAEWTRVANTWPAII
jgi:hypothetical protein